MFRPSRAIFGFGLLALCVALSGNSFGVDKDAPPAKGQLPPNWKKLGLNDDQVKKIYSTQSEYRGKIADLEVKVKDLKKQERAELEKVLTAAQKDRLKEILLEKAPSEKKPDAPKN